MPDIARDQCATRGNDEIRSLVVPTVLSRADTDRASMLGTSAIARHRRDFDDHGSRARETDAMTSPPCSVTNLARERQIPAGQPHRQGARRRPASRVKAQDRR